MLAHPIESVPTHVQSRYRRDAKRKKPKQSNIVQSILRNPSVTRALEDHHWITRKKPSNSVENRRPKRQNNKRGPKRQKLRPFRLNIRLRGRKSPRLLGAKKKKPQRNPEQQNKRKRRKKQRKRKRQNENKKQNTR